MAPSSAQSLFWALVRRQHGVISRAQLVDLGFSADWIRHRIERGRLHPLHRGVYAVGRPEVTQRGRWMAAVLACGRHAVLSHGSAALLWQILQRWRGHTEVSLLAAVSSRPPGLRVHRRPSLTNADTTTRHGIPVTTPARTLIDLATTLHPHALEAAVNEADSLDLIDPERLRAEVELRKGQPGTRALRALLDGHTFRLTDSELERLFLRLVRRAGLPLPQTQMKIAGRVDFHWPDFGLVVETDSLRYHRTAAKQALDLARDQAHAVAGRERLRFSHWQVRHEPVRVIETLTAVTRRLISKP